jgi:hypothetical protein
MGGGGLEFRYRRPCDDSQIAAFRCARYGRVWEQSAEDIIRRSVEEILGSPEYDARMTVAVDGETVVGVAVYGLEKGEPGCTMFSMGVLLARQQQGIGFLLKQSVMADIAAHPSWPPKLESEVHRANYRMLGLNKKLSCNTEPDPGNGEWVFCGITLEPAMPDDQGDDSSPPSESFSGCGPV